MSNTYKINGNITIPTQSISNGTTSYTYATTGANWNNPTTNFNDGTNAIMSIPYGGNKVVLEEKAALEVKGKVLMNGIDLDERLKTIERVLMIPERDATMEAKYPSLKKKYDEYIKALEKYRMWTSIKGEE